MPYNPQKNPYASVKTPQGPSWANFSESGVTHPQLSHHADNFSPVTT